MGIGGGWGLNYAGPRCRILSWVITGILRLIWCCWMKNPGWSLIQVYSVYSWCTQGIKYMQRGVLLHVCVSRESGKASSSVRLPQKVMIISTFHISFSFYLCCCCCCWCWCSRYANWLYTHCTHRRAAYFYSYFEGPFSILCLKDELLIFDSREYSNEPRGVGAKYFFQIGRDD